MCFFEATVVFEFVGPDFLLVVFSRRLIGPWLAIRTIVSGTYLLVSFLLGALGPGLQTGQYGGDKIVSWTLVVVCEGLEKAEEVPKFVVDWFLFSFVFVFFNLYLFRVYYLKK